MMRGSKSRILCGVLCFFLIFGNINKPFTRAENEPAAEKLRQELDCCYAGHQHTDACYKDGQLICGMSTEYFHEHSDACYDEAGNLVCVLQERKKHEHHDGCYTRTEELTCGLEEGEGSHHHTDECFAMVRAEEPACGLEENEGHRHDEKCYSRTLICGQEETIGHTHDEQCYTDTLICGQEETAGHVHTDECLGKVLICGKETGEGAHVHGESCRTLICGLEENDGHRHSDACRNEDGDLVCELEEGAGAHRHSQECTALTCTLPESEGHQHTEECYQSTFVCGKQEGEGAHSHTGECYGHRMTCGQEEIPAHQHGAECYEERLICQTEEGEGRHIHTEECYPEILTAVCGLEETDGHEHTEACYETKETLTCEYAGIHDHTDACFETDEEGRRICVCGYLEIPEHRHDENCFRLMPAEEEKETETAEKPEEDGKEDEEKTDEETGNDLTEETEAENSEANPEDKEPEAVIQPVKVITGFVQTGIEVISEMLKPALIEIEKLLPTELQVYLNNVKTMTEDTEEEGETSTEETTIIPTSWKSLQDYDESLGDYDFVPLIEGYELGENVTLPVIRVHVENEDYCPTGDYMPTTYGFEAPSLSEEESETVLLRGVDDAQYNAYQLGLLPAIRDQGSNGACWAFASVGAAETDLIHDGLFGTGIDLSELHLAYFTAHPYAEPKNGNAGDRVEYMGNDSYLDNGGNATMAYRAMANMVGLVQEEDAPYAERATYDPDPAEAQNKNEVQMIAAYLINPKDTKSIKNAIQTHGSVYAGIYAEPNQYYSSTYNSYYCPTDRTNHAVMLVGWDDSFPAANFREGYKPSSNGAWLARNSWGYEGYSFNGYFWLSYEDLSLKSNEALTAYDMEKQTYDYCYSYDSTSFPEGKYEAEGSALMSQTFQVDGGETIEAVGFETGSANLTATITVSDGVKTVNGSKSTSHAGFYLVKLNEPLTIDSTREVTLTIAYKGSGKIRILSEKTGTDRTGNIAQTGTKGGSGFTLNGTHYDEDARMKLYTTKTAGTSLIEVDSVKLDMAALTMEQSTTAQLNASINPKEASNQNITWSSSDTTTATVDKDGKITTTPYGGTTTITAMARNGKYATCKVTVNVVYVPVDSITIQGLAGQNPIVIDAETYPDFDNSKPVHLEYEILPTRATNKNVTWTTSNPAVATVDQEGMVYFLKNGTVTITVTSNSKEKKSDKVTIEMSAIRVPVMSVTLSETAVSLREGETKQLSATIKPDDATDNSLTWSSNNTAVATVSGNGKVTAVARGTAIITARSNEKDGGRSSSCTVTVNPPKIQLQGVTLSGTILKAGESITGNAVLKIGIPTTWHFQLQKLNPTTGQYNPVSTGDVTTTENQFTFKPDAGAYRVMVEAWDATDKATAYSTPFTVQQNSGSFEIEDIAYNPDPATAGEEVTIMPGVNGSYLPIIQAYYYIYRPTDELYASFVTDGSDGVFVPTEAGTFKVMVVVTDGTNWAAKWGKEMKVDPAPTMTITKINMNGRSPFSKFAPVALTIETENGEPSTFIYEVYYFDTLFMSSTSTEDLYVFRPNASGIYKIMVVCTDGVQWASKWSDPIYVYDDIPLTLSVSPKEKRVPLGGEALIEMNYSGGDGVTFTEYQLWNAGTGQIIETWAGNDDQHTFILPATGTYRVMGVIHDSTTWVAAWSEDLVCFDAPPLKLSGTMPDIQFARAGQFVTFKTECINGKPTEYYYQLYNGETNTLIHTETSNSPIFRYAFPSQGVYKIMTVATDGVHWDAVWGTVAVNVSDPSRLAITRIDIEGGTNKTYYEPFTVVPEFVGAQKPNTIYYEVYDDAGKMVAKTVNQEGSFTFTPPTSTKSKHFRIMAVATNGHDWTSAFSDMIHYSLR